MNNTEIVCVVRKHSQTSPDPVRIQWQKSWRAARKFGCSIHNSAEAETYGAMFMLAWQCLLYRQNF